MTGDERSIVTEFVSKHVTLIEGYKIVPRESLEAIVHSREVNCQELGPPRNIEVDNPLLSSLVYDSIILVYEGIDRPEQFL